MVIHQNSIEESLLNQIKSVFQSVLVVKEKDNRKLNRYDLQVIHRNKKSHKQTILV